MKMLISKIEIGLIIGFFFFIFNILVENAGGINLQLPLNIFVSILGCLLLFTTSVRFFLFGLKIDKIFYFLLAGFVSIILPVIFHDKTLLDYYWEKYLMLFMALIVYLALYNNLLKKYYLTIIFYSAFLQLVIGLLQINLKPGVLEPFVMTGLQSANGSMQQINIYAVFVSVGMLCGALSFNKFNKTSRVLVVIYIIATVYTILFRDNGGTGRVIVLISLLLATFFVCRIYVCKHEKLFEFKEKNIFFAAFVIILISVLLYVNKSSVIPALGERVTIYKFVLQGISEKLIAGHGLGTFPQYFASSQGEVVQQSIEKLGADLGESAYGLVYRTMHPHNEILLMLFEFGIVPFLLLIVLLMVISKKTKWISIENKRYLLALSPIVLSLNLTMTFYLSYWLMLMALMIFASTDSDMYKLKNGFSKSLAAVCLLFVICTLPYLNNTYMAVKGFHKYLITNSRDKSMFEVSEYNALGNMIDGYKLYEQAMNDLSNKDLVDDFTRWSEKVILYRPLEMHYVRLVRVLTLSNRFREAFYWSLESAKRYPYSQDIRRQFYPLKELYEHLESDDSGGALEP